MTTPPVVLTIAGSDSGAGAGVQADLKTLAALRVFGTSAITALTAQNTVSVLGVQPVPVAFVRAQIEAVLDDFDVRAVKTGLLGTAATIDLIAELAADGRLPNLVVDPVMVASTGARLLDRDAERLYVEQLLPRARVVTPNLREAGVLLGTELHTLADQRAAAKQLAALGPVVVVKGGHAVDDRADAAIDVIALHGDSDAEAVVGDGEFGADAARGFGHGDLGAGAGRGDGGFGAGTGRGRGDVGVVELSAPRLDTPHNHGSGCSFASAIAAGLAIGRSDLDAIVEAKALIHRAIAGGAGWNLGTGHGPLDHFGWENP